MFMKYMRVLLAVVFVAAFSYSLRGQTPGPQAVFNAAQASAGQATYAANCASCHLPDLAGQNEAPQLAGPNFRSTWGKRTPKDLI
jgi:mono/diheme cytochrome c family protein